MSTHRNAVSLATARRLVAIIGIVVLGQIAGATSARAQALDNLWMKVTVNAKGFTVGNSGAMDAANYSTTAYMYLASNGGSDYSYYLFTQTSPGSWGYNYQSQFSLIGDDHAVIVDDFIQLYGSGAGITGYQTAQVTVTRDKFGAVKKATITTLGAEAISGTVNGKMFVGGFKMKAVSIDSSKLPFSP